MKNQHYPGLLIICMTVVMMLQNCTKKETPVSETKAANKICDGNGKNTYYPLDSSNKWTFTYKMSGITQVGSSPDFRVKGHKSYGGKNYAVLTDPSGLLFLNDIYYREDAGNHNIYTYYSSTAMEYLEVPFSPTLNQSWTYLSYTRKVTSLGAILVSSSCSYSGLLEITEYDGVDFRKKMYYKKGLGFIYRQEEGLLGGKDEFILNDVKLK